MIKSFNPKYGQSVYDLTLKAYGSLDNAIKLCNDSGISTMTSSVAQQKTVVYDTNSILKKINCGYDYTTATLGRFFDPSFFDTSFFD